MSVAVSAYASFITDAGDSGLLLPLAGVSLALLWFSHSRRLAWLMLRSLLLALGLIAILKLLFLSCAAHWQPGLTSPSGHACLSAAVYGMLGTLLAAGRSPTVRVAIGIGLAFLVGLIAYSRMALGVHTGLEVLIGLCVGLLAQLWFAAASARLVLQPVDLRLFGLGLLATVVVSFGLRLPAESLLRHMARRVGETCTLPRFDAPGALLQAPAPLPALAQPRAQAPGGA